MATIGKAVSEESRSADPARRGEDAEDDVLELVDEVPAEESDEESRARELLSTSVAAAVAGAFDGLAGAVEETEVAARRLPVQEGGVTVEDMVREMLKPMLQEWLDAHLPDIVERLVRQEIEHLARLPRR